MQQQQIVEFSFHWEVHEPFKLYAQENYDH